MRTLLIGTACLASACGTPDYEYRGITDRSSCEDAVDAEERMGSVFIGKERDPTFDDLDVSDYVLEGTLYARPVEIRITCLNDYRVTLANYLTEVDTASAANELHGYFEVRLEGIYGASKTTVLYQSTAYDSDGNLLPAAKPWKRVSSWCIAEDISMGVLSYFWRGNGDERYSVAVGADFNTVIACRPSSSMAQPNNTMQPTNESDTSFAFAKAAPLSFAADRER